MTTLRTILPVRTAPYTQAALVNAKSETMAVVGCMRDGYWIHLFAGAPTLRGNCIRKTLDEVEALLAEAGLPIDDGWKLAASGTHVEASL